MQSSPSRNTAIKFRLIQKPVINFPYSTEAFLCLVLIFFGAVFSIKIIIFSIIIFSIRLLYKWEKVNKYIFEIFFSSNISYLIPYFEDNGIYSARIKEKSLKAEIEIDIKKHNNRTGEIFYLGIRDIDIFYQESLLNILQFNANFSHHKKRVNLYFMASFFTINVIYSLFMLPLLIICKYYFNSISSDYLEPFLIVIVLLVFSSVIYKFVKYLFYINDSIILKGKIENIKKIETIEIYKVVNSSPVEVNIRKQIKNLRKIRKELRRKEENIFQIATPIFFLAYTSFIVAYF